MKNDIWKKNNIASVFSTDQVLLFPFVSKGHFWPTEMLGAKLILGNEIFLLIIFDQIMVQNIKDIIGKNMNDFFI